MADYKVPIIGTEQGVPAVNDVLKWDGTSWVPGTAGDTGEFTFSISSFSDGQSSVQQIGGGEWKAVDAVTFAIVYNYGPATGANITMSSDDGDLTLWETNPLVLPSDYTSDTNAYAMDYPDTVNNYIRFSLSADKGGENDTDAETVYFRNKKYYGFSSTGTKLDAAKTLALSHSGFVAASANDLDTTEHTQTPSGAQYLHFLWPNRIGPSNITFKINGFNTVFTSNGTFEFDNGIGTGYTETYIDYVSPQAYDAAVTLQVLADV